MFARGLLLGFQPWLVDFPAKICQAVFRMHLRLCRCLHSPTCANAVTAVRGCDSSLEVKAASITGSSPSQELSEHCTKRSAPLLMEVDDVYKMASLLTETQLHLQV